MRVECPACSALQQPRSVRGQGSEVLVACAACGCESTLAPAAAPDGSSASPEPLAQRCPKCRSLVGVDTPSCGSCGLRRELFGEFQRDAVACSAELAADWAAVDQSWGQSSVHDAFLERAAREGAFAEAARRYREQKDDAARRETAQRMLGRIQTMAAAALMTTERPTTVNEPEPYRKIVVMLIFLMVVAAVGGIYAMIRSQARDTEPQHPVPHKLPKRGTR